MVLHCWPLILSLPALQCLSHISYLLSSCKTSLGGKEIICLTCLHRCIVDNPIQIQTHLHPTSAPSTAFCVPVNHSDKNPRSHPDPFLFLTMRIRFFRISWCLHLTCTHNHTSLILSSEAATVVSHLDTERASFPGFTFKLYSPFFSQQPNKSWYNVSHVMFLKTFICYYASFKTL